MLNVYSPVKNLYSGDLCLICSFILTRGFVLPRSRNFQLPQVAFDGIIILFFHRDGIIILFFHRDGKTFRSCDIFAEVKSFESVEERSLLLRKLI